MSENHCYYVSSLFIGPTICYEGMEDAEVPPTAPLTPRSTTHLFEVSPGNETVVEITVSEIPETEKPSIFTPFTEELTVSLFSFNCELSTFDKLSEFI